MLARPWIGIIALLTTYLAQPLGHSLSSLVKALFHSAAPIGFLAVGITGLEMIFVQWAVFLLALWVNGPWSAYIWGVIVVWLQYPVTISTALLVFIAGLLPLATGDRQHLTEQPV